jgi:hypothetical protein
MLLYHFASGRIQPCSGQARRAPGTDLTHALRHRQSLVTDTSTAFSARAFLLSVTCAALQ